MVSILGFVEAARANPAQRERALEVIRRQTSRLGRLVEDLLWAASVRNGHLAFHPVPVDFVALVRRIASEVEEATPDHAFLVHSPQTIYFLADEGLLSHALWSLLTYTNALSSPSERVVITIEHVDVRVIMNVQIHGPTLSPEELGRVFEPFSIMQYEGEPGRHRSAFGLFLCRGIAVIHGGNLRVTDGHGAGPSVLLDLPS